MKHVQNRFQIFESAEKGGTFTRMERLEIINCQLEEKKKMKTVYLWDMKMEEKECRRSLMLSNEDREIKE